VLLFLSGGAAAGGGEQEAVSAANVYVRTQRSIGQTMRYLEEEARRIDATQVIVAFDAATFDPPPGLTEFTLEYPFFRDLPSWLRCLEAWAERAPYMMRGTSSLAPKTINLKRPGAIERLESLIKRSWWGGEGPSKLPRAVRWMNDALSRTESAVRAEDPHPKRMLVLIASSVTPERWVRADPKHGYESEWRTKLAPVGTYFQEGRVAALLKRSGCRLYVIAPEARFGDFTPHVELPELPWAARPHLPQDNSRVQTVSMGRLPGPARLRGRARRDVQSMRELLEESLKKIFPDPEERKKRIEEILEQHNAAPDPAVPGLGAPITPSVPGMVSTHAGGLRFRASTPVWFKMLGGTVPFNNHAPSSYGIWSYASAAARTGGRYVFYPFPSSRWLDACPMDGGLVNRLAPEMVSRQRYLTLRRGYRALTAVAKACALVFDETPWADTWYQHRAARSWTSFLRTSPLRMEKHTFLRRKPYDMALQGSEEGIERVGEHLRDDVLPRYDRALRILDKAAIEYAPGAKGVHPRSHANLLLARYWFYMSAFHLEAYSLYALEVERFIPEDMRGHVDRIVVTYVPTIRMSDCLPAYDGRELSVAEESQYGRWTPRSTPGYQGNILDIPIEDPNFRARRSTASVLRHLDKRLFPRARRMLSAAQDVMETYSKTGWGWTTYYADAFTFVFKPIKVRTGHRPSRGGGKAPPRPTTPRGGGRGGRTSKPGGPSTGGKAPSRPSAPQGGGAGGRASGPGGPSTGGG